MCPARLDHGGRAELAEEVRAAIRERGPLPDQETQLRELVRRAVLARGALTDSGVANHWHILRLNGGAARIRPVADELVAAGVLERLAVEDNGASVLVPAGAADMKSDHAEGALTVKAFHLEPGVRRSAALDEAFSWALDRLRRTVGLERVVRR